MYLSREREHKAEGVVARSGVTRLTHTTRIVFHFFGLYPAYNPNPSVLEGLPQGRVGAIRAEVVSTNRTGVAGVQPRTPLPNAKGLAL